MDDRASKKSLPEGVRIRDGAVQIYWQRRGEAHKVTLPHPPTAECIKAATKIRRELITKHEWGVLSSVDIAKAKGHAVDDDSVLIAEGVLFQEVAQKYLKHCEANQDSKKDYVSALNKHWMPHMGLMPIHLITSDYIKDVISEIEFKTEKTHNNCLVPLRGVFDKAIELELIEPAKNPMAAVNNKKIQSKLPDPFTRGEMNALLSWLDKNLEGDEYFYYWYFEVAFWTGCRPSELLALKWSDVDWFNDSIVINKSRVRGIDKFVTKTHTVREVDLNDRSKRAFAALLDLNLSKDYVMVLPGRGDPFYSEKPARIRLVRAMQETGVRHRPAYNARHTYATMLLMAGVNPVFVANQLGHSMMMLMRRYGRWINGDKNKIEMQKLNTE